MKRAELKAEPDMREEVRARFFKTVCERDGRKDLKSLPRTWKDPDEWAHHDKMDQNVV